MTVFTVDVTTHDPACCYCEFCKSGTVDPLVAENARLREALASACVIGEYCSRHGYIHGFEVEELRQRLQALNKRSVNAILESVDARDSAAYVEQRAKVEARDDADESAVEPTL